MSIQVRFLYEGSLFGEWTDAADGVYLYPNPEFRDVLLGVQVRDDGNCPPPAHGARARSRAKSASARKYRKAVPNGDGQLKERL